MYAYIATDPKTGDEGVIGMLMPDGSWMPFVAADEARLMQLEPNAQRIALQLNRDITLIKLTTRETVKVLKGHVCNSNAIN